MIFDPKPCPCGCKKWIMAPWFRCQCSSLSDEEKDELMAVARDAMRYRELRLRGISGVQPFKASTISEQCTLDAVCDIMIVERKETPDAS